MLVDQQRGDPARIDILFHYQPIEPYQTCRSALLLSRVANYHARLGPKPITPSSPPSTPRSRTIAPSTSFVSRSFTSPAPGVSPNFASDPTEEVALAGEMFRFFFLPLPPPPDPDCRGSGVGTDRVISSVYAGVCVSG